MRTETVTSPASEQRETPDTAIQPVRGAHEDEIRELKASADIYAHRSNTRKARQRGDWWVAIGVYLLLASVALVIF